MYLRYNGTALGRIWKFAALLSIWQVTPDWFLAQSLGTLVFPYDGVPKIGGAVSVYMAFMWSIPMTAVISLCPGRGEPSFSQLVTAAVAALLFFAGSEQFCHPLDLWHRTDSVKQVYVHIALYVLPAELVLGPAALYAHRVTESKGLLAQVAASMAVTMMYTGALALSHLFMEQSFPLISK